MVCAHLPRVISAGDRDAVESEVRTSAAVGQGGAAGSQGGAVGQGVVAPPWPPRQVALGATR